MTSNAHPRSLRTLLLITAASLTLIAGCHKKDQGIDPNSLGPVNTTPPPAAAPTASISADPLAIELGQTVTLDWRTTNATTVTIDGIGQVNPTGTQAVSPSNSTNFHLVAKGDGGTTEASVRVTVRPAAPPPPATVMDSSADSTSDAAFHAAVQDVFFGYDSFDVDASGQTAVAQAAAYLVQHPGIKILIGGYADERGSAEYNLALGENRANATKTALMDAGVSGARIRTISYGKEKQFCEDATDSCYQQNRRAQFTIDR